MLIDLIILVILIWAFLVGYSRGLFLQAIYSFGTLFALLIASLNYQNFAHTISSWIPFASATQDSQLYFFSDKLLFQLDNAFYAGLAFLMIYVVVYFIIRFIGIFLTFAKQNILGRQGKIIAGILSIFASFFGLQIFFTILALVPMASLQAHLHASFLVRLMVLHTPLFSGLLQNLFITNITHLKP